MPPQQIPSEKSQQRPRGRRPRRRSRSGDGVVLANRKTEICLHWQNGCCPYGAGSCAFAHGLGELRHATLDDEAIAQSVSEDSESCSSSRDVSPSARRGRTLGRVPPSPCERRLPTFVGLSTGTTPVRGSAGSRHFSSPATGRGYGYTEGQQRSPNHQRSQSFPSPSSAFSDSYGFGVAADAPPLSLPSNPRGIASSAAARLSLPEGLPPSAYGGGAEAGRYAGGNYQPAVVSSRAPFDTVTSPAYGGRHGQGGGGSQGGSHHQHQHHRRTSSNSSGAGAACGPWSPGAWAPMAQQLDAVHMQQRGGDGFGPGGEQMGVGVGMFAHPGPLQHYHGGGGGGCRWG